jgi:ATP-GRASP peptide maturase of grasp-with-spasm system
MLLIQSSQNDGSTSDVIDWIRFLYPGLIVLRKNDATTIKKFNHRIKNNSEELVIEGQDDIQIKSDDIKAWWYRNGYWEFDISITKTTTECRGFSLAAKIYLDKEFEDLENSIDYSLGSLIRHINRYADNNTNKISNLSLAANLGLGIPDTLITNDVHDLEAFYQLHSKIITKAFARNSFQVDFGDDTIGGISSDTELITEDDITRLKTVYENILPLPSCYQQYVEKKYELRIFFFDGEFYAMAIFSQASDKTKLDFRAYDQERPNRCVPYNLPEDIRGKLTSFMNQLSMNSGSIDMIVTPEGDCVFLEVNPIGKYQWLRQNCNYDIDLAIARFMAENL